MIFDRTQADVSEAIKIRDSKVKSFAQLTDSEAETLERGFVTINTLNRIETAQDTLKGLLNEMGYYNMPILNKTWEKEQVFTKSDLERIVANLDVLRDAFFVYSDTPATPSAKYHYSSFNDLEKIIYDLDVMINDVKSHYKECGAFECGEE